MEHGTDAGGSGHVMMVFQWMKDVPVLFKNWTTSTALELALAMLVAVLLAAGYEWVKNWQSALDNTQLTLSSMPRWKRIRVRVFRSVVHALNAAAAYIQMILAMTFDLRIFLAIILGSGLGFFLLGPYFRQLVAKRQKESDGKGTNSHGHGSTSSETGFSEKSGQMFKLRKDDDDDGDDEDGNNDDDSAGDSDVESTALVDSSSKERESVV